MTKRYSNPLFLNLHWIEESDFLLIYFSNRTYIFLNFTNKFWWKLQINLGNDRCCIQMFLKQTSEQKFVTGNKLQKLNYYFPSFKFRSVRENLLWCAYFDFFLPIAIKQDMYRYIVYKDRFMKYSNLRVLKIKYCAAGHDFI